MFMLSREIIVFNAFFLVTEFIDYFSWFVFVHYIAVFVFYMC